LFSSATAICGTRVDVKTPRDVVAGAVAFDVTLLAWMPACGIA
jgi:hypothetical protein